MRSLIIGAGLSGLALARHCQKNGFDYLLVDARPEIGGRIATVSDGAGYFDLGPTWFWPGQPLMAQLVDTLGLAVFEQYAAGAQVYEDANAVVQYGRGVVSMQGSLRIAGGMAALTRAMAADIPASKMRLGTEIRSLEMTSAGVQATTQTGSVITADRAVLAMPPRIAARMQLQPALPAAARVAMKAVPTWMAGQAKAVAVYDRPFWRDAGLSGDATSRSGPMVEVHDASPRAGGPYGLFGFLGVPPEGRTDTAALRHAVEAQLIRLFGPQARQPQALHIKDWAFDRLTATEADHHSGVGHADRRVNAAYRTMWDGQLILSGSEVASAFAGYLEGALVSAADTFATIRKEPHYL